MKNTFKTVIQRLLSAAGIFSMAMACSWVAAQPVPVPVPELAAAMTQDLSQKLKQKYPATRFTSVSPSPLSGLYLVQMDKQVAYTDASGRYFLFGHMFDMQTRSDLTQQVLDQIEPEKIDFSKLPLEDAIQFGSGSHKVAVFADPDCPFCRKLDAEIDKLQDTQVWVFPFPIAQLHPGAAQISKRIWCAPNKAAAWRDYTLAGKQPPAAADCNTAVIERNVALANRLGINATPTLIAQDGRILGGARPAQEIMTWLKKSK